MTVKELISILSLADKEAIVTFEGRKKEFEVVIEKGIKNKSTSSCDFRSRGKNESNK